MAVAILSIVAIDTLWPIRLYWQQAAGWDSLLELCITGIATLARLPITAAATKSNPIFISPAGGGGAVKLVARQIQFHKGFQIHWAAAAVQRWSLACSDRAQPAVATSLYQITETSIETLQQLVR